MNVWRRVILFGAVVAALAIFCAIAFLLWFVWSYVWQIVWPNGPTWFTEPSRGDFMICFLLAIGFVKIFVHYDE